MIPYRCKNGHTWEVQPMGCGIRLCPRCEHRAAYHVEERLAFLLSKFKNPVRMLTLTLRNYAIGSLADMLRELDKSFRRLRNSTMWKRYVDGAVAVFECTVSEERGWHAHIHIAFDGKFMPHAEVRAAWIKATRGEGQQVNLKGQRWARAVACRYLSKYTSKGVKVGDLPAELVTEFVEAWWKFRTLRTYGTMFRLKYERPAWDGVHRCPECGEPGEPQVPVFSWAPCPDSKAAG
ncbi:MAG: protein rep [bacterium]|nr:protein rep [bacterium]